jgi:hypothetical protein
MSNSRMSKLSAIICMTMIVSMFGFLANAKEAFAAVTRVAVVTDIEGTVKVKKSGGTKTFNAFKKMSLNEGDSITTGKGASIVLELASSKAEQDEITIGENSQINFSKLQDKGGTKAKMNVWAGSLWVKVKSISNAEDSFEVETPTAIMGVRGTNFFQTVDPVTGRTSMVVASGVVRASTTTPNKPDQGSNGDRTVNVYPAQQIILDQGTSPTELKTHIEVVDIDQIIQNASPKIIEQIIKNAAQIQQENEEMKRKLQDQLANQTMDGNANLKIDNQDTLNKITNNLDNLIGNIVKQAVDSKKIEKAAADKLIEDANKNITDPNKKIDLNNVKAIDKNAGVDPALEAKRKQLEQEAQKRAAEEQRKLIENQQRLAALLKKIEEDRKRIDEANKKAAEEAAKKAAEQLVKQMDAAAKAAFEAAKKQREEEKKQQQNPTTQPGTSTGGTGTDTSTTTPRVGLSFNDPALANGVNSSHIDKPIHLNVNLGGFGTGKQIYGYQIAVEFDDALVSFDEVAFGDHADGAKNAFRNLDTNPFKVELASGWAAPANYAIDSVDHFYVQQNTGKDVLNYAVLKYTGSAVTVSNNVVVKLPFILKQLPASSGNISFKLTLTPVDSAGNIITGASPVTLDLKATVS